MSDPVSATTFVLSIYAEYPGFPPVVFPDPVEGTAGPDDLSAERPDPDQDYWLFYGYRGDDTLEGGDGAILVGGLGDDHLEGTGPALSAWGGLGNDTIYDLASYNAATLRGGPGDDVIDANFGTDTVRGGQGDDELYGYDRQLMIGGQGDDFLNASGNGTLKGAQGNDTLFSPCNAVGDMILEAYGGAGDDLFDIVEGLVVGGGGNDTVIQMYDASTVRGGQGDDSLTGSSQADEIKGNTGNDFLDGGGGNDTLRGGEGNDTIIDDQSGSGPADALILGGKGDDEIVVNSGSDTVRAGQGDDDITSFSLLGAYLDGGVGADTLESDGMNNTLVGGRGRDVLASALTGGDVLFGGAGADMFVFSYDGSEPGDGTIADYERRQDTIQLRTTSASGTDPVALRAEADGNVLLLGDAEQIAIKLLGFLGDLDDINYVFV